MIKFCQRNEEKAETAENTNGRPTVKKKNPGALVLQREFSYLSTPNNTDISFPNGKDDLMNFEIVLRPDEGYYQGGSFLFTFQLSPIYPYKAPKVKCMTKVYHPNIDLEGHVCLNILREDWNPVLNISAVIFGLHYLFIFPNHEDALNQEAAAVMEKDPKLFGFNVKTAMGGGYIGSTYFPRCISNE